MKTILLPLLVIVMLFTSACYGGGDDCCYQRDNPCYNKDFDIDGKAIAFIGLSDANRYWIPKIVGSQNITFKKLNTNAEMTYLRTIVDRPYYKVNVRTTTVYDSTCSRDIYTRDYANCVYELFGYGGSPGAKLDMSVMRKVLPGPFKPGPVFDSVNFYQSSEILRLGFANLEFLFNPNTFVSSETQKFHPSISFENVTYDSVYELWKPYADTSYIIPQGVYYSCKEGIIGMYLTNKVEVWYKK
jgi:hypothetical protein